VLKFMQLFGQEEMEKYGVKFWFGGPSMAKIGHIQWLQHTLDNMQIREEWQVLGFQKQENETIISNRRYKRNFETVDRSCLCYAFVWTTEFGSSNNQATWNGNGNHLSVSNHANQCNICHCPIQSPIDLVFIVAFIFHQKHITISFHCQW
jgi:hypothetical protein